MDAEKITGKYAQKLIDGLDTVDFIDRVKTQQRNWIIPRRREVVFEATTGETSRSLPPGPTCSVQSLHGLSPRSPDEGAG